jgi:hypothetical protein
MSTIQYNIIQCTASPTCAGDGINTRTMVLHNGSCTSLNCQNASNLEDYIFGRCPTAERPCQLHTYDLSTIRHASMTSYCHMTFRQYSALSAKVFIEADIKVSVLGCVTLYSRTLLRSLLRDQRIRDSLSGKTY